MHSPNLDLNGLLAPTSVDDFLRDHWEREPLHVSGRPPDHYANLMTIDDVDEVIAFSRPKFADASALTPGESRNRSYVRGWPADRQVAEASSFPGINELRRVYRKGRTIVIMTMQQRKPEVARLCRDLEGMFHCPVHANLYLTPPKAQGFDAHFDPHEVFVLQLEGSKTWRLYGEGREAPLIDEQFERPHPPLGPPREVELKSGDLLYIPRGHVHEAFTSDGASLHLTVGVNVYRWVDLLHKMVDAAARGEARFRRSLPPRALGGDPPSDEMVERCGELIGALGGRASLERALRRIGDQFFGSLALLPGGHFTPRPEDLPLGPGTVLEKAPGMICRVVQEGGWVAIDYPGGQLGGPLKIASALRMVARADRLVVRELPDELGDDGKLVLARRLVRDGLLRIVET